MVWQIFSLSDNLRGQTGHAYDYGHAGGAGDGDYGYDCSGCRCAEYCQYLVVCFLGIPLITAYNILSAVFRG